MSATTTRRPMTKAQQQARVRVAAATAALELKRRQEPADPAVEAEYYFRRLEGAD
jgi:hypothetical protein